MIISIGTGVAPANFAFPRSRSAALIECKMLQNNTTLYIKLYRCILSEIKTQVFTLSDIRACVSIHCVDQKQQSNRDFLTKTVENTLQTCVDTAKEYLHVYNTGVKSHIFCSPHQCK